MPSRIERIEGALIGLLVGDALGVPYEFHAPEEIPSRAEIEMEPPRGFERAHPSASIGAWSDDGAQALCLLESLLYTGSFDVNDFARRLVNWLDWGHLAVDGFVFDVGVQTSIAMGNISLRCSRLSVALGSPLLSVGRGRGHQALYIAEF